MITAFNVLLGIAKNRRSRKAHILNETVITPTLRLLLSVRNKKTPKP